ncbi:hypothetical protein [Micromonospora sp. NBRC 101691]|uniref:hypothetical protein n=1 Tax=Micromonospora sp. NBRC 101691 TaxID=3032198 RepID=UPI00249FC827|nr:hypothetical protein [Micromonospora sp. NBRC 101691]GLY20862.1 hypothetical protein Misp04_05940 [Micromonospora sp. NBRC 101691]
MDRPDRRPHPPLRPLWLCRVCLTAWPCPAAREALLRAYAGDRVGLCLFLAALMLDADADLRALHPAEPPAPAELFRRFLRWASRPHRAPPRW